MDPSLIPDLYTALRAFEERLRAPENEYRYLLSPGRLVVFDNWRVLHGRSSYQGTRRLSGCYLDRDALHSRMRVVGVPM